MTTVGIDLGTTFSAIAYIDADGKPVVIPNSENEMLTPSVVAFKEDRVYVGTKAQRIAQIDPLSAAVFIKRQMGSSSYLFLTLDGQSLPPEEISALILKKLKVDAEQQLGTEIHKAVISVPAYFNDAQRRATKQAAEMTGLKVLRLINEPTAAAIAYGLATIDRQQTLLIYDLGGGTFDVSILQLDNNHFRVIATDGNYKLGGIDFDNRLMLYLRKQYQILTGEKISSNPTTQQELRDIAEQTKKILSNQKQVDVTLPFGKSDVACKIMQRTLEDLIMDLIDLTLFHVDEILADAKISSDAIDQVVLVGGSTRIPLVRRVLANKFGKPPNTTYNPDEAVALGAAIVAQTVEREISEIDQRQTPAHASGDETQAKAILAGDGDESKTTNQKRQEKIIIQDVTSHSLGVEAHEQGTNVLVISHIIPRNTPIPVRRIRIYRTRHQDQKVVKIDVYEGESTDPKECVLIGGFKLEGLPEGRPSGVPLTVTMFYNTNGIIEVSAVDLPTRKDATITIHYESALTAKQVKAGQSRVELAAHAFREEWDWREA